MNFEKIITLLVGGAVAVAMATTVLGRSNSSKVIDAGGNAFGNIISASLGKGVNIR